MSEEMVVADEVSQVEQSAEVTVTNEVEPTQVLSVEQEIGALRRVHEFMASFDRVPGSHAAQWGQALDTIAVVANSLIEKFRQQQPNVSEEQPVNN